MTAGWASRVWHAEGATLRERAWWVIAPGAGVGIVLVGMSGLYFSPPGSSVALWWPAAGLAMSLALVTPKRLAWAAASIIFVATVAANLLGDHSVALSLWYGVGNVAEAGVGVLVFTAGYRRPAVLVSLEDCARLLVAALAASASLGVIGAGGIVVLDDGSFLRAAQSLTASHMAATLIIVPVVIAARGGAAPPSRLLEGGLQFLLLAATGIATYFDPAGLPTVFLPMPFLIWGALRLTPRLVSVEVLALGAIIILGTHFARGPFGSTFDLGVDSDLRLLLQASILVHALVAIPTAVASDQRRVALRDAQTTRDELSSVLDSSEGLAIIATDTASRIVVWGAGAVAMFGYSREEALAGLIGADLYAAAHREATSFDGLRTTLRDGARMVEGDWEFRRKDGSQFVGHLRLSRRTSPSGEQLGYLGVIEDVSQARKTEEALRAALRHEHEAVERLAALDRSKNDFISSVSHELRTPITSVIGYTDLMRAYDLPDEQRRLLDPVIRNAKRLEQLIEDLLTLSRMDGGTFVYRPTLLDLRGAVRSAVESVLVSYGMRRLDVVVNLGDAEIKTVGDGLQLERAVSNLVSNAVKFTPDGGRVAVDLAVVEGDAVLTVADTGIGIPKAEQGKVFDRFFRSSTSTFLAINGTGIGLHIVNQVVSAHRGRVSFESVENEGSTFTVRLPLRES